MAEGERTALSRVFISYRREDSAGFVRALLGPLRDRFGTDRIFKDTDNIPPGQDFLNVIEHELTSCKVLLAVIGNEWLTVTDVRTKKHRLDNPADTLRVEIAAALRNAHITVIPVLVDHAGMPAAEDLPEDLRPIARRNAFELSDSRWDTDVRRLLDAIENICVDPAQAAPLAPGALDPGAPASSLPDSNAPDFLERLAVKRKRQVADHIKAAKEAWEARDLPAVLAACERAIWLDPQDPDARDLAARAQTALDEQEIQEQLAAAQAALAKGDVAAASEAIDQVLARRPNHQAAIKLRQDLLAVLGGRERQRETDRLAALALKEAQASLDEGDFTAALNHVDDALALAAESRDALALRATITAARDESLRRRELKRRAQQTVSDAQAEFAAGKHEAALAHLSAFSPPHELVSQALAELQPKAAEALEAARQEKLARDASEAAAGARRDADAVLARAAAAFQQKEFASALELVEAARALDRVHPDLTSWTAKIQDAMTAEAAAERDRVERQAQAARDEAARVAAAHEQARREEADKLERENTRKRDEARRLDQAVADKVGQAAKIDDHEAALALLKEALNLAPGDSRVLAAISQRQAAFDRQREADERQQARRRAEEARRIEEARQREEKGREREAALVGILTKAREEPDDAAAMALLERGLVMTPGDSRLQALFAERQSSLERQNRVRRPQPTPTPTPTEDLDRSAAASAWPKYAAAAGAVVVAIVVGVVLWRGSGSPEGPEGPGPSPGVASVTTTRVDPPPVTPQVPTQQTNVPTDPATEPPPDGPSRGVGRRAGRAGVAAREGSTPTDTTVGREGRRPATLPKTLPSNDNGAPPPADAPRRGGSAPAQAGPVREGTSAATATTREGALVVPTDVPRGGQPPGPAPTAGPSGGGQPVAPPVDPHREAKAAIQNLLDEYVAAYSTMDERRMKKIVPRSSGVPGRALIESVRLALPQVQINISPDGRSASLTATGTYNYVWKSGRGSTLPPVATAGVNWKLERQGTAWVVVSSSN